MVMPSSRSRAIARFVARSPRSSSSPYREFPPDRPRLALRQHLVFFCPRYEGVDDRLRLRDLGCPSRLRPHRGELPRWSGSRRVRLLPGPSTPFDHEESFRTASWITRSSHGHRRPGEDFRDPPRRVIRSVARLRADKLLNAPATPPGPAAPADATTGAIPPCPRPFGPSPCYTPARFAVVASSKLAVAALPHHPRKRRVNVLARSSRTLRTTCRNRHCDTVRSRPRSSRANPSASRSSKDLCGCVRWHHPFITVRRIASGVGVRADVQTTAPVDKIELIRHGRSSRPLYFLRDRVGKAATLRERRS